MTPIKPMAILLAVFVTAAGSPGPEDTDLETQYGDQSKDLVDVTIPDEAVNLQRPGDPSNPTDQTVAAAGESEAVASEGVSNVGDPIAPGSSTSGSKSEFEVALSDDYIQGTYFPGSGLLGFDDALGQVSFYFSDERDLIGSLGLTTKPIPVFKEGFSISAGARGYLALLANPNDDVFAMAPGIQAQYALPVFQERSLKAVGSLYYAPDILTFGDATDIIDLDLRLEGEVIPNIVGLIGYREFRFDSDEGSDKRAASEIQVGARFLF